MADVAKKPKYNWIPTNLTEKQFDEFFLPHLSQPKRGPEPKITLFKTFNYILHVLYTGSQWKSLPIERLNDGSFEIHYSRIFNKYQYWNEDGSLERAFESSVLLLKENKLLKRKSSVQQISKKI